jgi:hypothetical protein
MAVTAIAILLLGVAWRFAGWILEWIGRLLGVRGMTCRLGYCRFGQGCGGDRRSLEGKNEAKFDQAFTQLTRMQRLSQGGGPGLYLHSQADVSLSLQQSGVCAAR